MESQQEHEDYIKVFLVFCSAVEPWIKRILIVVLAALILFQGLLRIPEIRNVLSSAERLEGIRINP
ncbi:hypothetical protein D3C77_483400 [compost metagenome]